jgi:hypothetical protein
MTFRLIKKTSRQNKGKDTNNEIYAMSNEEAFM